MKCPDSECDDCFTVSFLRYPRYNKTKRPRKAIVLSNAKWYVYALHSHLLTRHKNEDVSIADHVDEINGANNDDGVNFTDHDNGANGVDHEDGSNGAAANSNAQIGTAAHTTLHQSSDEDFHGFRENRENSLNENEANLEHDIEIQQISDIDGTLSRNPTTSNHHMQNPSKRKHSLRRAASTYKKIRK